MKRIIVDRTDASPVPFAVPDTEAEQILNEARTAMSRRPEWRIGSLEVNTERRSGPVVYQTTTLIPWSVVAGLSVGDDQS